MKGFHLLCASGVLRGNGGGCGEWARLDAESGQGAARLVGEGAQGGGDIGEAEQTDQGDGEVAQTRHRGRAVAGADARAVLIEGDVAHVMGAVLDAPMPAVEGEEPGRVGLCGGQAGDGKDGFLAVPAGFELDDLALDAADLCDMGEVDVVIERRAGAQAALLQASVALIEGLGAQGGNATPPVP